MMRRTQIIPLLLLALLLSACQKSEEQAPGYKYTPGFPGDATGEALFSERCRQCHRIKELGGQVGPDLFQVGRKRDAAFLERVIRDPAQVHPGTVMPRYDTLSQKQVDSLVEYLLGAK